MKKNKKFHRPPFRVHGERRITGQSSVISPKAKNGITKFLEKHWEKFLAAGVGLAVFYVKTNYRAKKEIQVKDYEYTNKMKENAIKAAIRKELEELKARLKEKADERKKKEREERELQRQQKEQESVPVPMTPEEEAETFRSFSDILNTPAADVSTLRLMFPFLHIGVDLGVVGPNNCGKTTLVDQIMLSLTLGRCISNLWPDCAPAVPMRALMFTTEQNDKDIKILYRDFTDGRSLDNLTVITEEFVSPDSIITGIEKYINTEDPRGLVVSIDNYTKLVEKYGKREIKRLNKRLDDLKSKYAKTHPLTIIKVYHTRKEFSPFCPLSLADVRDFQDSTNTTKNFIGLALCKEGKDRRILYVLKDKLEADTQGYYVIRYAETKVPLYTFDRKVDDINGVLPSRKTASETGGKRGRPTDFTDEQILELYRLNKEEGKTWQEIQDRYGISGAGIKKRRKEILANA